MEMGQSFHTSNLALSRDPWKQKHIHRPDSPQPQVRNLAGRKTGCHPEMFLGFEHEGLFLWSSTEITQLKHIHSGMEVEAHFAVHAECCRLTARTDALA